MMDLFDRTINQIILYNTFTLILTIHLIPKTIEKRFSKLSSNEEIFNQSAQYYEEKLASSGYKTKLKYQPPNVNKNKRNRKRNIIWFNPPYSKNVSTKIGKYFLNLVDKHFPRHHTLHKIFNRNTLKISYCTTKNIKSVINAHNFKILNENELKVEIQCFIRSQQKKFFTCAGIN